MTAAGRHTDLSRATTPGADAAPGQRMGPRMGPGAAAQAGAGARAQDFAGSIRRLGRLLLDGDRLRLAVILACTAVSVLFGVLGPWLLGRATDLVVNAISASAEIDFLRLAQLLGITTLLQIAAAAANWRQAWLTNAVVQKLSRALRQQAEEKLGRLPLAWFDRQPHGEVLSRVTNDIDNVSQSLQQLLSQLLMSVLHVIGVLAMMLVLSPLLTLAAVTSLTVSLVIARWLARLSQPHFVAQWRWTGVLNGEVEENYTGHTLMKVFGHRQQARERFETSNGALRDNAFLAQFLSGVIQPAIMFMGNLTFIAVVIGGALRVAAGALTIGALQSFIQYTRQLNQPMSQVSGMASILQSAAASAERVFELLDAPELAPDPATPAEIEGAKGHVVFDRVRFRYDPSVPLFENVSLEALPGQTVAIVGPTGAGKTTLVNLLMRFYEIDAGTITLDGVDIRAMSREGLRRHFGMVLQDAWLFSGTIRENIAYGREGATEDEILEAARTCHVDDFVRTLPQGYDTSIDENGSGLSVGQRQLLTIARAFLAKPVVLILDEATSSVDTRTELLVQRAMARLRSGRTSFVIAHRLSTIRDADLIVYMENGDVLEQGTHDALIARRGHYWRLDRSQTQPVD
ncbi:ATP-binding cassette subfamily B protein [Pseudochelatococcus lubricantis]|uniref:ATP-binding cassette subfamily B protein n=1 Tax=Pseudochelatococcus lubricantis TaxID=1538102 RepID=A0ABX0V192_9HYPH|nr:ATP-binding cassette subfamily B protein [Pseudochelatococcus lubricantis]